MNPARLVSLVGVFGSTASSLLAASTTQPGSEFFENRIRPLLTENCYKCHSPAQGKVKGGLELDWKGGWQKGGDSGPAIVPGDPEKSLLIKAVRYTDPDLQMPPKGNKLSPAQVADLVKWVQMGAPDPRLTKPSGAAASGNANGKDHWAFKPVRKPVPPQVKNQTRIKNDIDRFIVAKLEASGLEPNDAADKRTLLRRVYYDLIGLPPSPEQLKAFLDDPSPGAFEKVVDELLRSPHYGERWGRHWLDVARYSDAKGQFNRRQESSIYPYAWTYRDYVINAFNQDKPYDRFVLEQLAADKLSLGSDHSALAALGFLTVGDHYNGNPNEIINDRIDTTTKAFLGLTVACARCHDHKFDPIPQADYYSLHGIFSSSVEPPAKPELTDPAANPKYQEYLAKRKEFDSRLFNVRTQNMAVVFGDYKRLAGVYLYATHMPEKDRAAYVGKMGGDTNVLKHWQQIARAPGRQAAAVFGLWNALSRIPDDKFATQAPRFLSNLDKVERARQLNGYVVEAFKGKSPRTLAEAAVIYGNLFSSSDPGWQTTLSALMTDATVRFLPPQRRGQLFALREQSDLLDMVHPGAPARAAVLLDSPTPKDSPIFVRGEAENHGDIVPRRFLEVLSGSNRPEFKNGSGRLELAQAIASKNNALTARVLVNRVWQHHFGDGFILTPDDLGNQSGTPSHPELLDYMAARFMEEGWSIKKLHKLILLSTTYQQSSANRPDAAEKDPFNRLWWRANVRRLEFEPVRDSILYLGGSLDLTVGGHPVDLSEGTHKGRRAGGAMLRQVRDFRQGGSSRRSIYGYIDRGDLFEELNTFDFPSPASAMGKRYETTVPQQALFLMNSPLVIEQIRHIVQRREFRDEASAAGRIGYLYQLFFQRKPSAEELTAGREFIQGIGSREPGTGDAPAKYLGPWQEYAHALLLTNEASFVN